MSANLSTELREQIRAFQEEMLPKIPKPILDTFAQTTADLVRSGIAERALSEGSKAPDFSLPNVRGEQIKLSEVLKKGPAVVTFYRGGW
jgi:AhpC/TSA family protein